MVASAESRFAKANTNFSERGEYLTPVYEKAADGSNQYKCPALYTLKVKRCTWKETREKKQFYIVEAEVVSSSNPDVPVGCTRNWMQSMDNDSGNSSAPAFVFACIGLDQKDSTDLAKIKAMTAQIPKILASTLEEPTDPTCVNSLKDKLVNVEVSEIITKAKGTRFSLHRFFPYKSATSESKVAA